MGNSRSPRQDVNCSVHELAQMAVRALSPGINDPYTAVNCIDRLSSALCRLSERRMPDSNRFDGEGNLRLVVDRQTFASVIHAAFDQIRCYAVTSVAVSQRLLEGFQRIANCVTEPDQAGPMCCIRRGLTVEGVLEAGHHPADVVLLREAYVRLKEQLEPLANRPQPSKSTGNGDSSEEESAEEGEASGEVIG